MVELIDRICRRGGEKRAERDCARPEEPPEEKARRIRALRKRRLAEFKTNMGRLHADSTFDNYKIEHPGQREVIDALRTYQADLGSELLAGHGIVLFGPSGTGKDHLLAALAHAAILDGWLVDWFNGMTLYAKARQRISSGESEASFIDSLIEPSVLYLSDPIPPRGGLSDFQAATMQQVIDGRLRERKPMWISMNVKNGKQADELMGASLVDRLRPDAVAAFCNWPSKRKCRMVWDGKQAVSAVARASS
jgi:DNA replication protein DnaC